MSTTDLHIETPPPDIDPEWTTATYYINSILSTAESLGASRSELCKALNLPENCGDDPEKRLPMTTFVALLELAALHTGNPDLALIVGLQTQPQNHGILGMLGMCATNMLEGFKLWIPFRYALMHSGNSRLIETKETIRVIWEPLCLRYIEQRHMVDLIFSNWIGLGEQIYGHKPESLEVYFTYSEPVDTRLLIQRFGADIHFEQPHNEIVFRRSSFEKANPQHNPDMLRLMKEYAQKAHESQELTLTSCQQVTLALVDLLPKKRGTITHVADSLSMTERTLQRRLSQEKSAFNDLLRNLRYTQAIQRLTSTDQSVTDIALSLGYNDTGSFTKAFKQWTEVSPTEYRHRNARPS